MAARSADGFFVSAHGGNNGESHNHNDVGDFAVYYKGAPVIIDAGAGTYTSKTFSSKRYTLWFNTSPFHNLPTINSHEQAAGEKFKAENVKFSHSGKSTTFIADIAKSYPKDAGVQSWLRMIKVGSGKGPVITDRYKLGSAPKNLTQSFMTVCKADVSKPGTIRFTTEKGDKISMDYDAKFWSASAEVVKLDQPEDQKIKSNWNNRPVTRILLTAKNNPQNAQITYSLHP
ncbi:MAG: heparinase II/III family protein [Mucilaginibacter polytrichastri]|nr:heparinase II/III family protein [Mucilaginibacter polytrichastri]